MAGHLQVDTGLMQTTALQSSNKAENMIVQAKTLTTGIDFVVQRWQGLAGDAFRNAMVGQKVVLEQLIQRLVEVSEQIKRGAQGLDGQDQGAQAKLVNSSEGIGSIINRKV